MSASHRKHPGDRNPAPVRMPHGPPRGRHVRGNPRGTKSHRRSDERLLEDISEQLMQAGGVDVSDVTVSVEDRKVTLGGTVPERYMKHAIEDMVDACPGVQDIDNGIRVRG